GRRSWDLAMGSPGPTRTAQPASGGGGWLQLTPVSSAHAQGARGGNDVTAALAMYSPVSINVTNGSVRYVDERSGLRHDVTALDFDLAVDGGAGPLTAKGSFAWRGEKLALEASVSPLQAVLEQQ